MGTKIIPPTCYAGVLAIGLIGTVIARLKPLGMSLAMFATALAQFMVPLIAMFIWRPDFSPGIVAVLGLNFLFVLAFARSALLYLRAARIHNGPDAETMV